MVSDDRHLYLVGPKLAMALPLDRLGDAEAVTWRRDILGPNCPSPVLVGDRLFFVSDGGKAMCLGAADGAVRWQKRMHGRYLVSPLAAADRVYFTNTDGVTTVVAAEDTYREIATNDLGEPTYASFAVAGGDLFIRTERALYCVREPAAAAAGP